MAEPPIPIHLVKGDDVLIGARVGDLVDDLVGTAFRDAVHDELHGDDYTLGDLVMAATTVSMFGSRVVVGRNAGRFTKDDLGPLLDYLGSPAPDTVIVLAWESPLGTGQKQKVLPTLSKAIAAAGGVVHDTSPPQRAREQGEWIDDQLRAAGVDLTPGARRLMVEQLGEDLERMVGLLTVLRGVHGDAEIDEAGLTPYLGSAGSVPPWDLTDAIDRGDVAGAVTNLHRMLSGGGRHPLQVMVTLSSHVERMVRLDGSGVRDEKAAASLLGMKGSTFPAKKALTQSSKLGSARLARATQLLAAADVDLRGRTAQDGAAVLDVLVARLAMLARSGGADRARGGAVARPR